MQYCPSLQTSAATLLASFASQKVMDIYLTVHQQKYHGAFYAIRLQSHVCLFIMELSVIFCVFCQFLTAGVDFLFEILFATGCFLP